MAALRFLVVEGNTRPARERHADAYGLTPAASYAAVLQEIEPGNPVRHRAAGGRWREPAGRGGTRII
jgi:hypothetical protein